MNFDNNLAAENSESGNREDIIQGPEQLVPLRCEELLNYIDSHKNQADGDLICIGAGYGEYADGGETICRLDLFSQELINAKKENHSRFFAIVSF